MIRFIDLRYTDAPDEAGDGRGGPFAFLDTVTNLFVEFNGMHTLEDMEDFLSYVAELDGDMFFRCLRLIPKDFPGHREPQT